MRDVDCCNHIVQSSLLLAILVYFFAPRRPALFANISFFTAKRFGDLYGRLEVFFFGLSAIIRVMALLYINFDFMLRGQDSNLRPID